MKAPKIRCPMSGKTSGRIGGGLSECEHCGKMVFVADRSLRVAAHYLPAKMARAAVEAHRGSPTPVDRSIAMFDKLFTLPRR